jgi:hypothetical protein
MLLRNVITIYQYVWRHNGVDDFVNFPLKFHLELCCFEIKSLEMLVGR